MQCAAIIVWKRRRKMFIAESIAECDFKLCVWAWNGSNKLHNERTCCAWLLIRLSSDFAFMCVHAFRSRSPFLSLFLYAQSLLVEYLCSWCFRHNNIIITRIMRLHNHFIRMCCARAHFCNLILFARVRFSLSFSVSLCVCWLFDVSIAIIHWTNVPKPNNGCQNVFSMPSKWKIIFV